MHNETVVMDIWINITKLTSRVDAYYGHEIFEILDLITLLLDRQNSEMKIAWSSIDNIRTDTTSYLTMQIDYSRFGAETINNLISHDMHWDQLINVSRTKLVNHAIIIYVGTNLRINKSRHTQTKKDFLNYWRFRMTSRFACQIRHN